MFEIKELLVPLSISENSEIGCTAATCTCTATGYIGDNNSFDEDEYTALETALFSQ